MIGGRRERLRLPIFILLSLLLCMSLTPTLRGILEYRAIEESVGVITRKAFTTIRPEKCGYQEFPIPANNSGLPYLSDVFRDASGERVTFVATTMMGCRSEYKEADNHFYFDGKKGKKVRFLCEFHPGGHKVLSDYVFPTQGIRATFSFQCNIPQSLRNVTVGSEETELKVSLYSIEDYAHPVKFDTSDPAPTHATVDLVEGTHSIPNIPICSNLWSTPDTPHELAIGQKTYNLTLFVMIRLLTPHYKLNMMLRKNETHGVFQNNANHLYEWFEYHLEVGVEHFIVYDNDDAANVGRLRDMLMPYIQRGIVTYVWFPQPYCVIPGHFPHAQGQFGAELSALYRYGPYTQYYGDIDLDEFLYIGPRNATGSTTARTTNSTTDSTTTTTPLLKFLDEKLGNTDYDVARFRPYVFSVCNGTAIHPSMLLTEMRRCFTGQHMSDYKLIMKPSRILYYVVHYPLQTVDWTKPNAYTVNETTEGLLLHFKIEKPHKAPYMADDFEGIARTSFRGVMPILDGILPKVKTRMRQAEIEYGINATRNWNLTNKY